MENSEVILRQNINNYLVCLEYEFKNLMDRTGMYISSDSANELYTYSYSLFVNYVSVRAIIQSKDIIGSFGITTYPRNHFDPQSIVRNALFKAIKMNIKDVSENAFLTSLGNHSLDSIKKTNVLQTTFKLIVNPELMMLE